MAYPIVDCNCILGPRSDGRVGEPTSLAQLIEDMKYFGIDRSLVSSATSRDYSPSRGNQALVADTQKYDQLEMVWTVDAPHCLNNPQGFIEDLICSGAKALVSYPKLQNYSLAEWSLGPMLELLAAQRIPLLIPRQQTDWHEVQALCQRHPDLPIILTRIGYRELNYLYAIWGKHKNLYIDISWLSIHRGLEAISQAGFLGQLIFGSYYPYYSPGGALGILEYANISEEQKAQIAGSTLEHLLSWGTSS